MEVLLASTSSQRSPVRPGGHMQVKSAIPSIQVLPKAQGEEAHSLMLTRQSGPVKPDTHSHTRQLTPSTQMPPL